ncbi:MAG: hypothetical protein H6873_06250 [Hyphomicrobiaceae bacterium]|nr:hypothetical protein [Hyphomicrobiaceae bacterium]
MTDEVNDIDSRIPDEAELLLPWYVSGRISPDDKRKVESWLTENPDASAHLARASEEMDLTFADAEALGQPTRQSFDALMARIEPKTAKSVASGWIDRLWAGLSPRYALAGIAALFLLVLAQGAIIGLLTSSSSGPAFQVAGAETAVGPQQKALVAFVPGVSLAEITSALDDLRLRIIDGPAPGGIYTIAAPDTDAGKAALASLSANAALVTFFSESD